MSLTIFTYASVRNLSFCGELRLPPESTRSSGYDPRLHREQKFFGHRKKNETVSEQQGGGIGEECLLTISQWEGGSRPAGARWVIPQGLWVGFYARTTFPDPRNVKP